LVWTEVLHLDVSGQSRPNADCRSSSCVLLLPPMNEKHRHQGGMCCLLPVGGVKKRVGTRFLDTTLIPQPTVSTISLQHPASETSAYSNQTTSGRSAGIYPSQINHAVLPPSAPSSYSGTVTGARVGTTQPLQLNYSVISVQPNSTPSSHSGLGARPGGSHSQPSQLDYFSPSNDRWSSADNFQSLIDTDVLIFTGTASFRAFIGAATGTAGGATAELSQRRPRDAPNIWVPWKVSRVLTTHPATFPEICNGL